MAPLPAYRVSSRGYYERAAARFAENSREALLYAVLELRCAIEARLQEILELHGHISNNHKSSYRIDVLAKAVSRDLADRGLASEFTITFGDKKIVLQYIPVPPSLQKFWKASGNYLHALASAPTDDEWVELRAASADALAQLEKVLEGRLLGPPLLKEGKLINLKAEFLPGHVDEKNLVEQMFQSGVPINVRVRHYPL